MSTFMKILIAEDDPISRKVLERILVNWDFEVTAVTNGRQAWDILQRPDAPNLILLDWMMPELSGPHLCRLIREQETDNPAYIVLLTAMHAKEDIVTGLESGANDFITKPYNQGELKARLGVGIRMLDLQSKLREKINELEHAAGHIRTLQGILPICMHCHKIRTDDEAWERVDMYVSKHTEAEFSHSLCPECLEKYYPQTAE